MPQCRPGEVSCPVWYGFSETVATATTVTVEIGPEAGNAVPMGIGIASATNIDHLTVDQMKIRTVPIDSGEDGFAVPAEFFALVNNLCHVQWINAGGRRIDQSHPLKFDLVDDGSGADNVVRGAVVCMLMRDGCGAAA